MPQREESLTFIKFVAIMLVVMVHTSAPAFVAFGPSWRAGLVYDSAAHICVPLFFMVTGVLLLGRQHTILSILRRIWRVVVPLVIWSIIYLAWDQTYRGNVNKDWFEAILTNPYMHLWFLYALISVYAFLPILSAFFQNASISQKYWVLGAWFVGSSVLRLSDAMIGKTTVALDLSFVPIYSGYALLGAVLFESTRNINGPTPILISVILWIVATCSMCIGSAYYMLADGKFTMLFVDYWTPTVIVASAAAFISLKLIYERINESRFIKPLLDIGNRTFGIYLIHLMVLVFILNETQDVHLNAWLSYPLITLSTLVVSWGVVALVQRMPVIGLIFPK